MKVNLNLANAKLYFAIRHFRKVRVKFYVDLAAALKDKEVFSKFIAVRKARAIKQRDPLLPLYSVWQIRSQSKGGKLSHVLLGSAPESDIMVLAAIEDKGDLPEGLRFLASTIKGQEKMGSTVKTAIFTPSIACAVLTIFLLVMAFYVTPVFIDIAPPSKWPFAGKVLYYLSMAITDYGVIVMAGAMIAGTLFVRSFSRWSGPRRARADQRLPYRIYRDYQGAIFLISLATMMKSGDSLVRALEQLQWRASPWLRWHLAKILQNIPRTQPNYGEAFATGIFSTELTNRLTDYSRRSGEFAKVIERIGIEGMAEVQAGVEEAVQKLQVALFLTLGAVVAFFIAAILLTSQGMSGAIKAEMLMQQQTR